MRRVGDRTVERQLVCLGQVEAGVVAVVRVVEVGLDSIAALRHGEIEPGGDDRQEDIDLTNVDEAFVCKAVDHIAEDRLGVLRSVGPIVLRCTCLHVADHGDALCVQTLDHRRVGAEQIDVVHLLRVLDGVEDGLVDRPSAELPLPTGSRRQRCDRRLTRDRRRWAGSCRGGQRRCLRRPGTGGGCRVVASPASNSDEAEQANGRGGEARVMFHDMWAGRG